MKKVAFICAVILLVIVWKFTHGNSPVVPVTSKEEVAATLESAATPAAGQAPAVAETSPHSESNPVPPNQKVESTAPVPVAVTEGLERFPVDPEVEKYISHLNISAEAKKILLSAVLVHSNIRTTNPRDFVPMLSTFEKEIEVNQADVMAGLKSLVGHEKDFPPGFADGVMAVTSNLGNTNSPEIQSISSAQIQNIKNNQDLNSERARGELSQSIASYVAASPDHAAAWAKIKETLDLNDPNQQTALQGAKLFVQSVAK